MLQRFGLVWFSDHFGRTENLTDSSVQAVSVNPELDLRFGSEGGLVPVLLWLNSEPNHIYKGTQESEKNIQGWIFFNIGMSRLTNYIIRHTNNEIWYHFCMHLCTPGSLTSLAVVWLEGGIPPTLKNEHKWLIFDSGRCIWDGCWMGSDGGKHSHPWKWARRAHFQ